MILSEIQGNSKLIERLHYLAASGNLSHAYIFEGDSCTDKGLIVDCFIKGIFCSEKKGEGCEECLICRKINNVSHEDLIYVEADGNSIKDEAIEELQNKLKKKPFFGERNIAVIRNADTMTVRAQNRLLKTLEEPHQGTILFLLSENTENLVRTILSRCVVFRVNPFATADLGQAREQGQLMVKMLLHKEPFYALKAKLTEFASDKESALKLFDEMEVLYGELAVNNSKESRNYKKEDIYRTVGFIEEARRELQQGMNINYTMKKLILKIGG